MSSKKEVLMIEAGPLNELLLKPILELVRAAADAEENFK